MNIIIQSESGQHLGFLLFSELDSLETCVNKCCIFTGFPINPELLELPLSIFIQDRKHIEFLAKIIFDEGKVEISIDCGNGDTFGINISETGTGSCYATNNKSIAGKGKCLILPESN